MKCISEQSQCSVCWPELHEAVQSRADFAWMTGHDDHALQHKEEVEVYPEIPITIAGTEVPSFMMHQLLLSALNRASSSSSCRRIGTFCSLRSLTDLIEDAAGT